MDNRKTGMLTVLTLLIVSALMTTVTACSIKGLSGKENDTVISANGSTTDDSAGSGTSSGKPTPGKTNSDKKDDKPDDDGSNGVPASDGSIAVFPEPTVIFSKPAGFYEDSISVTLSLPEGVNGTIYYTISDPNTAAYETYTDGTEISLPAGTETDPAVYCINTFVQYDENNYSYRESSTYFVGPNVNDRYSTLILSVSGNPSELTYGDGIFYGNNSKEMRGKSSERVVSLEMFSNDGTLLVSQRCGVRPFGGFSRALAVKSMKFYAREEYNSLNTIKTDVFGTPKQDGSDKVVKSYKRLVARNGGNDFGSAYFRDELAQIIARDAGLPDTEGILPVTVYLNGSYHGLLWLHENYSNKYFKEKYGDDAPGEFVVIEGGEAEKTSEGQEAADFNAMHTYLAGLDMTDDNNFAEACEFMDVYNYLDYYAYNMYIANLDWPHVNQKCYRYYAAEGEEYGEGAFDGRWRFLPHDMDMSMGISESSGVTHDSFDYVMSVDSAYYSPLFTNLLKRPELKTYFRAKMTELSETVFKPENVLAKIDEVDAMRSAEYPYFRAYLDSRSEDPNFAYVPQQSQYDDSMQRLKSFWADRANVIHDQLDFYLPEY